MGALGLMSCECFSERKMRPDPAKPIFSELGMGCVYCALPVAMGAAHQPSQAILEAPPCNAHEMAKLIENIDVTWQRQAPSLRRN